MSRISDSNSSLSHKDAFRRRREGTPGTSSASEGSFLQPAFLDMERPLFIRMYFPTTDDLHAVAAFEHGQGDRDGPFPSQIMNSGATGIRAFPNHSVLELQREGGKCPVWAVRKGHTLKQAVGRRILFPNAWLDER